MNKKNFIAIHEDFTCSNCGTHNKTLPSGTRNHCHQCLCSLHVDDQLPGDRASTCHGLMRPIGATQKNGEWIIIQRCDKCGHTWKNRLAPDDNFDIVLQVSHNPISSDLL